jgi:uncharacterized delta-60 repeat protein
MTKEFSFTRRTTVRNLISPHSILLAALVLSALLLSSVLVSAADGDLDASFGNNGIVVTNHSEFDQINDIVIQPDGKIVAAGQSGTLPFLPFFGPPALDILVVRYNIDGSLDSTFGSSGIVTTDLGANDGALAVALQADGKIVVAGNGSPNNEVVFAVVRYNTNGSLDTTFGSGGIVTTSTGQFSIAQGVAIQSDGKIVVTGSGSLGITVVRYNTDGSLDDTFNDDGITREIPPGFEVLRTNVAWGVALQADGKIVVVGESADHSQNIGTDDFLLLRYNPDGSLDNTFDGDGLVLTAFATHQNSARDIVIQSDGKILAAGSSFQDGGSFVAVARYNTDGSLDTGFDSDGIVVGATSSSANALALQSDGKILAAGDSGDSSGNLVLTVSRFNSDGSSDTTFGGDGIVTTSFGTHMTATAIAPQTDGRIVAAGYANFGIDFNTLHLISDLAVVRYGSAAPINHPPVVTITGPSSGSVFSVNTPVNFTGTFTDDAGDTHTAEWKFESITQPATVIEPLSSTPGSANTTYTFTEAGVYNVSLTITDNGNLSSTSTTVNNLRALVVIYDPNGGWVTGGGWINSPEGAFTPIPTLSGKASFGFVSKYQKGASVPVGSTEFQFQAAGLNFESTSYDWMVISGTNKAQFKGAGKINGSGTYRFMLTCIDGDQFGGQGADKFRIRIWSDNLGLIYDNQLNAPNDDDPTTVLGGGSIEIHR